MKELIIHLHDLTIMVKHKRHNNASAAAIVQRLAERVIAIDPEMPPAGFVARLIGEIMTDSRFNDVLVMARFDPIETCEAGQIEVCFETGELMINRKFV